jgi:hypothetical protein
VSTPILGFIPMPRPLWWAVPPCRHVTAAGAGGDTDLIHPDGHHYADDGDFYCADCWEQLT